MKRVLLFPILALVVLALYRSVLFVDETETVIVTQFGRPVRTLLEAGLHFKPPYQSAIRIDRRLQIYDPRPSEFLTKEKKNVDLDVFVCWRVDDPQRFLETVNDFAAVEPRMHDIVWSELAAEVGSNPLEALVSTTTRPERLDKLVAAVAKWCAQPRVGEVVWSELAAEVGRDLLEAVVSMETDVHRLDELLATVAARCADRARSAFGIEIVDVRLKRISLPAQVRDSVFQRMRSERARIARQYRAEGDEGALKIRAEADKQRTVTLAKAYARAEKTRGEAEAEAIRVYTAAHQKDPQFYELLRTLEAYKKFLDEKTTVVLSADSDLLKYLTRGSMLDEPPEPE